MPRYTQKINLLDGDESDADNCINILHHWHCPNCAEITGGYADRNGTVKVRCLKCGITMYRKHFGRRKDVIEMINPN